MHLYGVAASIWGLVNPKAKLWVQGRKDTMALLQKPLPQSYTTAGSRVWFHCSSLGEFEQARPLMEAIKQQPDTAILLTFFSSSGYEVRKNFDLADIVCYLPHDTADNAAQFIAKMKPNKVYWTKYDFWLHHLEALKNKNIPVFLFSAIFRKEQFFFQKFGYLFRDILKSFTHIFVQDVHSKLLVESIGITEVSQANDTRFDRVIAISEKEFQNPIIDAFAEGSEIIVAGSTWPADEQLLLHYMNSDSGKKYKYIIAPHNLSEEELKVFENNCSLETVRYSQATDLNVKEAQVLLIDNYGMLSALYRYGRIAYVGGGFGSSVHNVLEAAVYGVPVLFGPKHHKSKECIDLIAAKGAITIKTNEELLKAFDELSNTAIAKKYGDNARTYVYQHKGGTAEILSKTSTVSRL